MTETEIEFDFRSVVIEQLEKAMPVFEILYQEHQTKMPPDEIKRYREYIDNLYVVLEWARKESGLVHSTDTAAKKAKTTPAAIRKAIERKQLRAQYLGAQYAISDDDLNDWMKSKRKPGRPKR